MSSSEERELRDALEKAQQEAKELRGRVGELSAFKPEELLARIHELEANSGELRARLEIADKVRVEWDARVQAECVGERAVVEVMTCPLPDPLPRGERGTVSLI